MALFISLCLMLGLGVTLLGIALDDPPAVSAGLGTLLLAVLSFMTVKLVPLMEQLLAM